MMFRAIDLFSCFTIGKFPINSQQKGSMLFFRLVPCIAAVITLMILTGPAAGAVESFETDFIETDSGSLEITFIGHGTLMFRFESKVWHVDPYSRLADYTALPKADVIVITHHHRDQLDPAALERTRTPETVVVLTGLCAQQVPVGRVMKNGEVITVMGVTVEAVPAYNLVHKRGNGQPFHPKREGNGYVFTFSGTRVYVAGDTENIPEMKNLKNIDYAFLPMNLPYTMTPEMAAEAALSVKPGVVYPYHYGETDPARLTGLLRDCRDIEVRIRSMR